MVKLELVDEYYYKNIYDFIKRRPEYLKIFSERCGLPEDKILKLIDEGDPDDELLDCIECDVCEIQDILDKIAEQENNIAYYVDYDEHDDVIIAKKFWIDCES